MTDRPIPFTASMIRALLAGRKTMTRRVLENVPPQPEARCHDNLQRRHDAPYLDAYCGAPRTPQNPRGMSDRWCWWQVDDRCCLPQFRVGYAPGDRLWVREAWRTHRSDDSVRTRDLPNDADVWREADRQPHEHWPSGAVAGRLRTARFMPRWASRITLLVEAVAVERLQDISEADAIAELGFDFADLGDAFEKDRDGLVETQSRLRWPQRAFSLHWNDLNAKRGFPWDANPWVAAIRFRVVRSNIDALSAEAA